MNKDDIRNLALQNATGGFEKDDPVKNLVASLVRKMVGLPQAVVQGAQEVGSQAGNALGQIGQGITNYGNMAIDRAGHILGAAGPITQAFGNYNPAIEKYSGGVNYGTDIGVATGTKVALPKGRWQIIDANTGGFNQGYGNSIYAQNLETGEKLRMSHLSAVGVKKGDIISGGQVIGQTGNTGNTVGSGHLDLEYYDKTGRIGDVTKSPYGQYL